MPYIGAGIQKFNTADGLTVSGSTELDDKVAIGTGTAVGTLTTECTAGDSNFALTAYHPTSTSARTIAKFQSNVGSTQADKVTILCDGNVGIGTNSPSQPLEISGDAPIIRLTDTGASNNHSEINADYTSGSLQISADTANASSNSRIIFAVDNTERGRIDSNGDILIGKTSTSASTDGIRLTATSGNASNFSINAGTPMQINRNGDDGGLINFLQAGSLEGGISVSGSTVSYTGGHLSRWSQATDGSRIDGLVKGTVMTNLDQMAKWHHEAKAATLYEDDDEIPEGKKVGDEKTPAVDAYDEDNEQLNCMAVSSVEGDANVAGVFVNWDEDDKDYTNDMVVAMTGDMVIRIAKDTTVARGDLLMSAGDGTAKPQGDDIVRSKTIAKVTSTVKSHTYDDGSYLLPCVLMAC